MLGNRWGLVARDGENPTAFAVRLMRAEVLEEAAKIIQGEMVTEDQPPDPTDVSYNMAIVHAVDALRRAVND